MPFSACYRTLMKMNRLISLLLGLCQGRTNFDLTPWDPCIRAKQSPNSHLLFLFLACRLFPLVEQYVRSTDSLSLAIHWCWSSRNAVSRAPVSRPLDAPCSRPPRGHTPGAPFAFSCHRSAKTPAGATF